MTDRCARRLLSLILVLVVTMGCKQRDLRGAVVESKAGQTYLVVDDDNGGNCGPINVDGQRWPHPLHVPGTITPGRHVIECGGEIEFEVKAGTTFHFEYWGP